MQSTRRDFVRGFATLPVIGAILAEKATVPDIGQPAPITAIITKLDGYTSLTRVWGPGDAARCRLCPLGTCEVVQSRGVSCCTVLTDDKGIDDANAPLWSSHHTEYV